MKVKTIYVETTNQCNLNCRTCYNRSGLNRTRREISVAQLKEIIACFTPYGLNRFLISGGEPTLHSEFNAMIDLVDIYPMLSFGIVTNGTIQNTKFIQKLNTLQNFTLQISLDGSCELENCKTRGSGNFDKTIAFAKQIHNTAVKPLLKMVISQSNFTDIEAFYELALSIGFTPEFAFIFRSGNGSDDWTQKALSPQQKLKALKLIDALNVKHDSAAFLPLCTTKCPFTDNLDALSLCIKTDGSIQPCQQLYNENYTLGNVFRFDTEEFSEKLSQLSLIAKKRMEVDFGCKRCVLRESCGKGCMASAVTLNADPLAEDGDCDYRKLQFLWHEIKNI